MSERVEYVSTSEAATRLGVAPETIRNWMDRGAFPGTKRMGRNYRLDVSDVARIERDGLDFAELESERAEIKEAA